MKRVLFVFLFAAGFGALYGGNAAASANIPSGNGSLNDVICGFHNEIQPAPDAAAGASNLDLTAQTGISPGSMKYGRAATCHDGKQAAFHSSTGCCLKNCGGLAAAINHDMTESHFLAEAEALPKTPGFAGILALSSVFNKGRSDGPNPRPPSI